MEAEKVLDIYIGNDYYFNKILNIPQSIINVEQDITNIPDGVQKSQKNYIFSDLLYIYFLISSL